MSTLTAIGYSFGAQTVEMGWAELVHSGKAIVKANLLYIIPALLAGFALYVFISNRIMRRDDALEADA